MQSNSESNKSVYFKNPDVSCNEQLNQINLCSCKECISFYSICFSTLKSCNYWTSKTVDSIIIINLPVRLDIGTGQ